MGVEILLVTSMLEKLEIGATLMGNFAHMQTFSLYHAFYDLLCTAVHVHVHGQCTVDVSLL